MLTLVAAQTLDGQIARSDRPGTDFTSGADAAWLREALAGFDSMIMGRKTYETMRSQIQESSSRRFLRKVLSHEPERYRGEQKAELIEFTELAPKPLLAELRDRDRRRTALLGGGQVYSCYLAEGVVDALWITIEAKIFGNGVPIASGDIQKSFDLQSCERLGEGSVLLKYSAKGA